MSVQSLKIIVSMASMALLLLFTSTTWAQEEPNACVALGGLAWDNWTKEDGGGSGLPDGEDDNNYVRCKACHGWDHRGTDGGYVRRSRNDGRPNAGFGDGDQTSRDISFDAREGTPVTADMIFHAGTGRSFEDGSGGWVALDDMHSAANKTAHATAYTLGNQHPDFSTGGANALTQEQADCLAEFLNFEDAGWDAYFHEINPDTEPVLYTIRADADAGRGETFYEDTCDGCHGDPTEDATPFAIEGGSVVGFLSESGHMSEFYSKVRWGNPDTPMTRDALGDPTSLDTADVMLYLQELGGTDTEFAMTPGMTGTWWNGLDRSGEGFPIEVGFQADGTMILWATFFTYNNMGDQTWLTAIGTVDSATVSVDVFMPQGPMWGGDFDPADGASTPWGSGTFTFTSCASGHMSLEPNDDMMGMMGFTDLEYDLKRFDDFVISGIGCPTSAAQLEANAAQLEANDEEDHDHDAH